MTEGYFNLRRQRTLRRYSRPVDLERFDRRGRMTSDEDRWYVAEHLCTIPHLPVLPPRLARRLSPVEPILFRAGLVGRAGPRPRAASRA